MDFKAVIGRNRFRFALGVAAIAVGGAAIILTGGTGPEGAAVQERRATLGPQAVLIRPAPVLEVTARAPTEVQSLPGVVYPLRASRLAFRVSGPLVELPVREGDVVKTGTRLAQIDPRDFELTVEELRARLAATKAAKELADTVYRRQVRLFERGAVSDSVVDEAVAERDRRSAEIRSLARQLDIAEAALKDTALIAPFDGRVARVFVENHDYVRATETVVILHDTAGVEVVVDLPESAIPHIPDIHDVRVRLSQDPGRVHPASIREIASDGATESGTYRTTLRLDAVEEPPPLAGMSATVYLVTQPPAAAQPEFRVPSTAVYTAGAGKDFVWVVRGNPPTVTRRSVVVAGVIGPQTRIGRGLANGERIVTAGVQFLEEGQQIRPVTDRTLGIGDGT